MKKTYITPEIAVVKVGTLQMIAASFDMDDTPTDQQWAPSMGLPMDDFME